jgi:TolB protein
MTKIILCVFILFSTLVFSQHQHKNFAARTNYCPQWSPDGSKILFYSQISGRWQIMSVNIDGTQMSRLSKAEHNDYYPSYSPRGDRIVFHSRRDGNDEIYTAKSNGTDQVRLTKDPKIDSDPRWSPDGKLIAFVSTDQNGGSAVEIMFPDGSNRKRLTDPFKHQVVSRLSWSPDSSQIITYISNDGKDMSGENLWTLVSITLDGNVKRFEEAWRRDSNPDWSVTNTIIFDAHKQGSWESDDGGWEIFSMKPDGSGRTNLTTNEKQNEWGPSWSPDGKQIAYCSGTNDSYEIFIMNADGSNPQRITFNVR